MSYFLQAAESIARELNEARAAGRFPALGEDFAQGTIELIFDAHRELPEMQVLRLDVVLNRRLSEAVDRGNKQQDLVLDLAFRRLIRGEAGGEPEKRQLSELVGLEEEVETFFTDPPRRLKYAPFAMWQKTELVFPYLPTNIDKKRQFTGLLRLTYRIEQP